MLDACQQANVAKVDLATEPVALNAIAMLPQAPHDKPENSTRVNLLISLFFHVAIVAVLVFFAAREGLLGKQLKKIAVQMVKESRRKSRKNRKSPRQNRPKPEPPKTIETPKVETAQTEPPKKYPPPRLLPSSPPPSRSPHPPADLPSFVFGGGQAVQTSSDPVQLYKGSVEHAFLSKWHRPGGIADDNYVAEVEVAVDSKGRSATRFGRKAPATRAGTIRCGRPSPPRRAWTGRRRRIFRRASSCASMCRTAPNPWCKTNEENAAIPITARSRN